MKPRYGAITTLLEEEDVLEGELRLLEEEDELEDELRLLRLEDELLFKLELELELMMG